MPILETLPTLRPENAFYFPFLLTKYNNPLVNKTGWLSRRSTFQKMRQTIENIKVGNIEITVISKRNCFIKAFF